MFEVTKNGPNRLDVDFGGKLDSYEMKAALDELFNNAKDIQHGRMLYRVRDFDVPTLGAIGVELSRIPEAFRFIKRFDRAAVLADKNWIKKASEIEGAFIPGLKIKAFDFDQEADAESWLVS